MSNALEILQEYWKHNSFREPQKEIIDAVVNNNNVVALLPTGGGKSVCFQVPAMMSEGICLVISPLIALMQDQVDALNEKGIKALALTSGFSQEELINLFDNLNFGNYKFLYLSPERLQSSFIQEKIKQLDINLIAIDEAHCISEWGHDFRPSYRNIKILKELKPSTPLVALTATATKEVLEDITKNLEITDAKVFKKTFYRDSLAYQIFMVEDKLGRLLQICKKNNNPIIVYVNSRNKTKEIADFLNSHHFKAGYYHGGLNTSQKQEAFDNWLSEKTPIIVATNAFGMGIDKENVKVVVHLDLPNSIENYIQEAGRAGRNGEKAFSVVLTNTNDLRLFKERQNKIYPTINEIKKIYKRLCLNYQIAKGELVTDTFEFSISKFCNDEQFEENKVATTLNILQNNAILSVDDNYQKKSTVRFLVSSKTIINFSKSTDNTAKIIQLLLRSYGGIFEQETKINEFWIAKKAQMLSKDVISILEKLHQQEIINYCKTSENSELVFLTPREDDITINRISKNVQKFIHQKINKANQLLNFIENNKVCRNVQILHYFNEKKTNECGICDVCLSKKNTDTNISEQIIAYLKIHKKATSKEICQYLSSNQENILINLQQLLAEEIISINHINQYYLTQ